MGMPLSDDEARDGGVLIIGIIVAAFSAVLLPDWVNFKIVLPALGIGMLVYISWTSP
jgi:hypothetical protein